MGDSKITSTPPKCDTPVNSERDAQLGDDYNRAVKRVEENYPDQVEDLVDEFFCQDSETGNFVFKQRDFEDHLGPALRFFKDGGFASSTTQARDLSAVTDDLIETYDGLIQEELSQLQTIIDSFPKDELPPYLYALGGALVTMGLGTGYGYISGPLTEFISGSPRDDTLARRYAQSETLTQCV